jgi:hypothetical protein
MTGISDAMARLWAELPSSLGDKARQVGVTAISGPMIIQSVTGRDWRILQKALKHNIQVIEPLRKPDAPGLWRSQAGRRVLRVRCENYSRECEMVNHHAPRWIESHGVVVAH